MKNYFDLSGRVAGVTGASTGLGGSVGCIQLKEDPHIVGRKHLVAGHLNFCLRKCRYADPKANNGNDESIYFHNLG